MSYNRDVPQLLLGKDVANALYEEIKQRMHPNKRDIPLLAVVQVGDDPASNVYIKFKKAACEKMGFGFRLEKFATEITTTSLEQEIRRINDDTSITGCIIQLPLPDHIDKQIILNCINCAKDVDCFSYTNVGKMYYGQDVIGHVPATAWGILRMIQHYGIETRGKLCVILGKSTIVGRPLGLLLGDEFGPGCTVVMCDKNTENRANLTKIADIIVVEIKKGAVIIDVGIHHVDNKGDQRIIEGDVDFEAVKHKCSWITPVPGGVGPTTVATLIYNLARPYFI
jgi:methylenetetrahydrofolate dehydrogenase (NADP+) / methenyltetrahydrofolate cyclohydrolase